MKNASQHSQPPEGIFLVTLPGLEDSLAEEAKECGFKVLSKMPGGVDLAGRWPEVWRANLELRGATRVLARIGSFMAFHPAQLDKRARKFPWHDFIAPKTALRVEVATSRKSKIYHARAAQSRIETALVEAAHMTIEKEATLTLKVRIDDNRVSLSLDTSGDPLHKRGFKQAVGKAPLRETMAAMFLRQCGFDGSQNILDPMCGSGTIPIEAAEIASGLQPGRGRHFAFQALPSFEAEAYHALKREPDQAAKIRAFGSDRDSNVIAMAQQNAQRAGLGYLTHFKHCPLSDVQPVASSGIVLINPPYGARINNKKALFGLYAQIGDVMRSRFEGWTIGLITSEADLAYSTKLNFSDSGPAIAHGGLRVRLFRTG